MAPVEDNADAHDRNRVEVGLRRSYGRDNSRFHRNVEPGVRLNHQTGTLVHRERPEQAVFKNGKLHLKRVQGNKSGVDRRHPGRQDQKGDGRSYCDKNSGRPHVLARIEIGRCVSRCRLPRNQATIRGLHRHLHELFS